MNNANIKVDDIVKVVDWGKIYLTNYEWLLVRVDRLNPEWLVRYAFGDRSNYEKYHDKNSDNRQWKVLFVDGECALITEDSPFLDEPVYLIKVNGLSPFTREMTLSEIEAELGYAVKIVEEK